MAWYIYEYDRTSKESVARVTKEKVSIEQQMMDVAKKKKLLEGEVAMANKEKADLLIKINEYETRLKEMSSGYDDKIKELNDTIEQLRQDLAAKEEELPKKNSEIESLRRQIAEYEGRLMSLNKKAANHETSSGKAGTPVTLEPITVTGPEQAQAAKKNFAKTKKLNAKVVDVNKEFEFIVINAGKESGINADDTLFVYRKKKMLGKVLVERVGDGVSVARILYKSLLDEVKKDDEVST